MCMVLKLKPELVVYVKCVVHTGTFFLAILPKFSNLHDWFHYKGQHSDLKVNVECWTGEWYRYRSINELRDCREVCCLSNSTIASLHLLYLRNKVSLLAYSLSYQADKYCAIDKICQVDMKNYYEWSSWTLALACTKELVLTKLSVSEVLGKYWVPSQNSQAPKVICGTMFNALVKVYSAIKQ